jgi:hypothetical protein
LYITEELSVVISRPDSMTLVLSLIFYKTTLINYEKERLLKGDNIGLYSSFNGVFYHCASAGAVKNELPGGSPRCLRATFTKWHACSHTFSNS